MNEQDTLLNNTHQTFLEILPLQANAVDLASIDPDAEAFASSWAEQLLKQGQLQINAQPDFPITEILQHFYFSSRNHERVKGLSTLGFGYPMLLWKQDDITIAAPLFIWQLELILAPGSTSTWVFSHRKGGRVAYNRHLAKLLNYYIEHDTNVILAKAIRNNEITLKTLERSCEELAEKLGVSNLETEILINPCPDVNNLSELQSSGTIQRCGVVGLFPPQILPESTLPDEDWVLAEEKTFEGHEFGLLPMDAHQASALQTIFSQKTTVVEGSAGTGKTHLLVQILSNALSNGQRCLVVSENMGALRQIQNRLAQLGLTPYNFLLQDEMTDKSVLLDLLRSIANADTVLPAFDEVNFRATLDKSKRLKSKLDKSYGAVRNNLFGPFNWTQTVGQFLKSNRIEGKELLASQLNPQDFLFTYDEYLKLQDNIRISFPLYAKVNTLRHPLSNLHESIFTKKGKQESLDFIRKQLDAFLEKAESLHHRFINKINAYTDRLAEHYEGHYGELSTRLARLKDQMADYSSRYGADFEHATAGALKLRGVFSGKVKSVLEARDEVAGAYLELVKAFEKERYFDYQFSPSSEGKNIQKVSQNLASFEKALYNWRDGLPALVQEELSRLNAKNANEDLGLNDQIGELEYALDLLADELNETKLYAQPFENKTLTIPRSQKYLEEIIEQLETTRLALRDYDHFYDWQRNWLSLPDHATRLIRALIKVKPNDWLQAFESWYLNNVLTATAQDSLPTDDAAITDFVRSYHQLKKLLPNQISHRWQSVREDAFKAARKHNRDNFNLLFGKKNQELAKDKSLRELLTKSLKEVTSVYPILLATPYAVENILALKAQHFDYVLFDESQYLQYEQAWKPLQMGKKAVIFGNCSELPAKDESVILGWAKAQGAPNVKLQTCHRWNPGNLLQLIHSKNIDETAVGQFKITFEQLDGRYDETNGTNEEEAQHIIHLLNDIKPTEKRTFPTVGIACFTVAQRDLIASYLLKIKQKWSPGVEKIQQLERNGLGVFHIDELRGQHFDVLIVSATYGIVNAKGEIGKHTEALNTPTSTCSIRLLMTRALQELYIINSIPQSNLEAWLDMPEQPGLFLFANYLAYNQALQKADANRQQSIAQRLQNWAQPTDETFGEKVFLEEIATTLHPYLGQDRIKIGVEEAQLRLPLLIEAVNSHQPGIVLQPNGFFADTPTTDFVWEDAQKELLIQHGFAYQPVWSVNWWKNPRQEARKLASAIIKTDSEYVSDLWKVGGWKLEVGSWRCNNHYIFMLEIT
ncbi:MAG: UvrD-helicase domain-containing protein [Saprospiraceae bacterium]|nr:UvrD-helicase domain-containing protein [Saprospiraceae bacterium]